MRYRGYYVLNRRVVVVIVVVIRHSPSRRGDRGVSGSPLVLRAKNQITKGETLRYYFRS